MALSKAEVRRAFQEAMAADYADIPAKEDIDHVFSPAFYAKMDALIAEQKRGSWRLLSRQRRRVLVVAAILMSSMLLVACTPKLRETVAELAVTVYETFVRFTTDSDNSRLRKEIETVYEINPASEGIELISQECFEHIVRTVYKDEAGNLIMLQQIAADTFGGSVDNEHGDVFTKVIQGEDVLFSVTDAIYSATWTIDGYGLELQYAGITTQNKFELLIASITPAN